MKFSLRALAALLVAVLAAAPVLAQDGTTLGERDKVGYMLGQDVARAIGPGLPDVDLASFQQTIELVMAGGQPALDAEEAKRLS